MSEPITEGLTEVIQLIRSTWFLGLSNIYTNTSEQDITINSVGMFSTDQSYSPPVSRTQYLLTKTLLDKPLILKPNDTKIIQIIFDFNKMLDNVNNS